MTSLKESAIAYVAPAKTRNIVDLPKVSTEMVVETKEVKNRDGETFTIQYVTVAGEQYRIPSSVLGTLKLLLEDNPNLKEFKVKSTGQGLDTRYTVIPLQ